MLPLWAHRGSRGIALLFLDLGARWGWLVNATPPPLYPRERSGTHCIGGWVGLTAGLDGRGKSRPTPGFDPRTVQPVASRYTDCAIIPLLRHKMETRKDLYLVVCMRIGQDPTFYDVLLTVHLSIILVINQLNAHIPVL